MNMSGAILTNTTPPQQAATTHAQAWQHLVQRQESTALNQTVLNNTPIITAQTQAILDRLCQP